MTHDLYPPDIVGGLPVVCFIRLDERHRFTGKARHYYGSELLGRMAGLVIARSGSDEFYLFGCDEAWLPITDTLHASLDDAMDQAEFEYQGTRRTWITAHAAFPTPRFPCPACGFLVFNEPAGSYDICDICGWEDDEVQLRFPGYGGGANVESLCEHQREWLTRIPPDIQIRGGFRRGTEWRPLRADECVADADDRDPYIYYWRRTPAQGG